MRHNQFRVAVTVQTNVTRIMVIVALSVTGAIGIASLHGQVVSVKPMESQTVQP